MSRNALIAQHIFNTPLLIHPNKLDAIIYGLQDRLGVVANKPEPGLFTTTDGDRKQPGYRVVDGVGIVDIFGVLAHRGGLDADSSYILGYQEIARRFDAAMNDPQVHSILLNVDSPGGAVSGAFDLSEKIFESRGDKKIVAVASDAMTSAAYLIASAADEVVVTRTSNVGSIGVVMRHVDFSQALDDAGIKVTYIFAGDHKVDGNPYEALPADVRDRFQQEINNVYQLFIESVVRNRSMKEQDIINTQAQIYLGPEAIGLGLADSISTPDKLIARLVADYNGAGSRLSLTSSNQEEKTMADENLQEAEDTAVASTATQQANSDEPANVEAAVAEARTEERQRIATIMNSDVATGREAAALALATETDMTAEAAIATLGKMPITTTGKISKLDVAMAAIEQPNIGSEGEGGDLTASDQIVHDYKVATGTK